MGIPHSTATHDSAISHLEDYTIYTFKNCAHGSEKWNRDETTQDIAQAIARARGLFDSGAFCKVEIRKTAYDPKTGQMADRCFKIFRRPAPIQSKIKRAGVFCTLVGVIAVTIGFLMIRSG
jgi:hypothetical protein